MTDAQPLRTIRLYGSLRRFGREFRLAVASPAEAVRALCVLVPGFEREFMTAHERGYGFGVFIDRRGLTQDELHSERAGDIRIAPCVHGAKRQGWVQIIVGVVVIAAAAWFTGGAALGAFATGAGGWGAAAVGVGASMVLGGVAQLLTPTPRGLGASDGPDNGASYRFNGPVNTTAQGNPVPVLYGELIIGSAAISGAIVAEDQQ